MPTTSRYLSSVTNLSAIFQKIRDGVPPEKFNTDHLKAIGFGGSNDRAVVPLLKDLGFLTNDGAPAQRYRDYRDPSRSRAVMAEALREAYPDLFVINESVSKNDREAVVGRLKSLHDSSDVVAGAQARTFFALLDLADLKAKPAAASPIEPTKAIDAEDHAGGGGSQGAKRMSEGVTLTYRFEIQLPATRDVDVFRAIFRAMKEELLND